MDFTQQLAAFIGMGASLFAIAAWFYAKLSRIESALAVLQESARAVKERVDLLYGIVVEDSLRQGQREGRVHRSELGIEPEYAATITEGKSPERRAKALAVARDNPDASNGELAVLIVKALGWETVLERSEARKLLVQDYIALWIAAMREMQRE